MSDLEIIILAAGKGTRMVTDGEGSSSEGASNMSKPKVLFPVSGRPMLSYVLDAVAKAHDRQPLIVVGFQAEKVKALVGDKGRYVLQSVQKGTGHAVKEALAHISPDAKHVIVLYGDQPLVSGETIKSLYNFHISKESPLTLGTVVLPDFDEWRAGFYDFGRIIRGATGQIEKIVEKVDATDAEREITEVSPSYFCFRVDWLKDRIGKLGASNQKGEYYLTDLVEIAKREGIVLHSTVIPPHEALGVNTPDQLDIVSRFIES